MGRKKERQMVVVSCMHFLVYYNIMFNFTSKREQKRDGLKNYVSSLCFSINALINNSE